MRSRFASNLVLLVLGAVLVTMSPALPVAVVGWLSLGIGCATGTVTLAGFALRDRGRGQRLLDAILVMVGAWMIVSSRTFSGGQLRWLAFSGAVAIFGLSVLGLVGHQVIVERELRRRQAAGVEQSPRPVELHQPVSERAGASAW